MLYGINERKGLVLITGEVGTGKTTLIYTLLQNLSKKVKSAFIYHTTTTFEQLLRRILLELHISIDDEDKTSLLNKLNEYLIQKMSQGETLAIIIDEAHNLPKEVMEEFRMLSNLQTSKSMLLQILLVGQPELGVKLDSKDLRQLKQRIGIRRQIKPLSMSECTHYIEYRLNLVGSSSSKVFTSETISLICKYSKGIPRTINILCDNALLTGYGLTQKKINRKIIKEVIEDLKINREETFKTPFPFKSLAVSLLIIIFLSSLFLLLKKRDTFFGIFFNDDNLKKGKITQIKEDLSSSIPTEIVSDHTITSADAQQEIQNKPAQKKPATFEEKGAHIAVLKKGEGLYSLALKNYRRTNETLFDLILQSNSTITDVREIHDNQKIIMPVITPESYIKKDSDGTYQIHVGTFETFELVTLYSHKVIDLGKQLTIKAHKFSSKDTWYRLMMGNFNSKEEALKTVILLKEQNIIYIP